MTQHFNVPFLSTPIVPLGGAAPWMPNNDKSGTLLLGPLLPATGATNVEADAKLPTAEALAVVAIENAL
jgi:hypothetical protein